MNGRLPALAFWLWIAVALALYLRQFAGLVPHLRGVLS